MPHQKDVTHDIGLRQFSVLLEIPWSKVYWNLGELKYCFDQTVKQEFEGILRTSVRVFRSSSKGRFTIIFDKWQQDIDTIFDKLKEIAIEALKTL